MARNIEELKLDEITSEFLLDECIEMGEGLGVDTRQGSLYRDAAAGHIIRISKFFNDLRQVNRIISLDTCTGDILEEYMRLRGLTLNPEHATYAKYYVIFSGTAPKVGSVMSCAGHFFTLDKMEDDYILVSQETGSEMNNLVPGELVIPEIDVDGLISATLGNLAVPALDIENDDSARQRLKNRIAGPDENGNKSQIRTWCESVEGVGRARVIPLWNGANTVAAVIISTDGGIPASEVVDNVQEYLDPGCEGMGEGAATIGQFFTAFPVQAVSIDVSVNVIKSASVNYSEIREKFIQELTKYFHDIAMVEEYLPDIKARYSRIGAILSNMDEVIDYEDLKINGSVENIPFMIYQIPVVGEVNVNGYIS